MNMYVQQIIGVKGELSQEEHAFLHTKLSPVTRRNYVLALRAFKGYSQISEDISMLDPKILKQKLIEYIVHLKEAGLSYSKQNMTISAVQKLYQLNDLAGINWDNVRGYTSDDDTSRDDEPYTAQELQTLVEHASPRTKAIILTMLSAGLRIGAVPSLRIKHLQKLEDKGLYRVLVYADSKRDRYTTFTTQEAARAIDAYIKTREIAGEVIKPDSPVFRTQFDTRNNANGSVKAITKNGVYKAIEQLVVSVGIRKPKKRIELGVSYAGTHSKPLTHSFRKIMNTSLIRAGCKPVVVELLMGHNIGLQQNYLRLSTDELCQEYCKALDMLTVSQEKQLQQEVSKLRSEISDVGMLKHDLYELREQNKWLQEKFNLIINDPRKVAAWHSVRKMFSSKEQQQQD
jgi:site-specific recombinase XerD